MIKTLKLLLPILLPSWQFFKEIAPSPRIEFRLLSSPNENINWQEFRPRPRKISLLSNILRFFYNAEWNETMYMINCAESLIIEPSQHADTEIKMRIKKYLITSGSSLENKFLEFRIIFINRKASDLETHILYESSLEELTGDRIDEL
ncbi:MAG: hypothetical protein HRT47_02065 [Candidatus Caenarcaniphilales bacterium]|nr:hypothetical protein [Candidatus Caenarcaniphilales bacterium]